MSAESFGPKGMSRPAMCAVLFGFCGHLLGWLEISMWVSGQGFLTTRHHWGVGGSHTTHPPTLYPPPPFLKVGPNFLPGLWPIKHFLWRLRRQLV